MKIAISAEKDKIEGKIDQRFGRCKYFLIIDTEDTEKVEAIENQGALQGHGAGIKAAQQLGSLKVQAIITGSLGPNATSILKQLGIKAYHSSGSVKDAVNDFIDKKLEEIREVTAPHSGMEKKETSKRSFDGLSNKFDKSRTERIFFPLLENNGEDSEISQHFGHAPFFGIYDVEKKELKIIENDLDHTDPNKSPIDQIEAAVNPTTIFAKGIGGRAINIIAQKGLSLKTGNYNTVREVIENLDKLEDQNESCGHRH